jgi:hypothetical protein
MFQGHAKIELYIIHSFKIILWNFSLKNKVLIVQYAYRSR